MNSILSIGIYYYNYMCELYFCHLTSYIASVNCVKVVTLSYAPRPITATYSWWFFTNSQLQQSQLKSGHL